MAIKKKSKGAEFFFEESLGDNWASDFEMAEVPLDSRSFRYLGLGIAFIAFVIASRVVWLGLSGGWYAARADANFHQTEQFSAPRGIIYDRFGKVLADNTASFLAILKTKEFLQDAVNESSTLGEIEKILGVPPEAVWVEIRQIPADRVGDPLLITSRLTQPQVVQIKSLQSSSLLVVQGFERNYFNGQIFSSVLGYVGAVSPEDLKSRPELSAGDAVGKTGLEYQYDAQLRGEPGEVVRLRDSRGQVLEERREDASKIGHPLRLTIDADLQTYFYNRLTAGLRALGRQVGAGLAMNPKTGEVLALVNVPGFDNNLFSAAGKSDERQKLLSSPLKPLFNRVVSGQYNPGSTIKPLVAVAALTEGVISPQQKIYSPGYLEVPNRYNSSTPSRFLDWRPQGWVDTAAAIAQSSNVYFYLLGGGSPPQFNGSRGLDGQTGIHGLGITRLHEWWQKFNLGKPTGIDLPGEADGLLPSPEVKEKTTGTPWLLGDTYNATIGQGDLLLTPLQLLTYISGIANNGKLPQPYLVSDYRSSKTLVDLSPLLPQIQEVQKGMRETVTAPLGTAYLLRDLPFSVAAKTGTAQIQSNTKTNSFFVGYAPPDDPQVAILVLVENSVEGSLNTIPIAKDTLNWYYENRIKK